VRFSGSFWDKCGMKLDHPIFKKELYVLLVALKYAPRHCNLRILCDNITCIMGIPSGGGMDSHYQMMVKRLHKTASSKDITFAIHYVHTTRNPADEPSRRNMDLLEKLNSASHSPVF
jgi:hypothetical protein